MKRGIHTRCSTRMIGLPINAKNIESSTGRIRLCAAHNTVPTAIVASTTAATDARGRGAPGGALGICAASAPALEPGPDGDRESGTAQDSAVVEAASCSADVVAVPATSS